MADATHSPVIGVDDATSGDLRDALDSVGDLLGWGQDKAAETVARMVVAGVRGGQPLHFVAFSKGTLVVARGLKLAKELLVKSGMSQAQVEARLREGIKVETFGGGTRDYPDGPCYVHYVNSHDLVALLGGLHFGWFTHPGRDARIRRISFGHLLDLSGHNLSPYLDRRVPFDQAWQAG